MARSVRVAKILSAFGSALLLLTAGFHATALAQISNEAGAETAGPLTAMTFEAIWLMPSITWVIIALLSLWLAFRQVDAAKIAVVLALIPLAHAAAIYAYTGPFIGGYMLTLSGGLMLAGALLSLRTLTADRAA